MQVRSVASVRIERAHWLPPISKWPPKDDAEFFFLSSRITTIKKTGMRAKQMVIMKGDD